MSCHCHKQFFYAEFDQKYVKWGKFEKFFFLLEDIKHQQELIKLKIR